MQFLHILKNKNVQLLHIYERRKSVDSQKINALSSFQTVEKGARPQAKKHM